MKKNIFRIILVFASIASFSIPAWGITNVGGIIGTDTTWNLAGSPYIIVADVQVADGVTLTD